MIVEFRAYPKMGICQEFLQTVKPILIFALEGGHPSKDPVKE